MYAKVITFIGVLFEGMLYSIAADGCGGKSRRSAGGGVGGFASGRSL